ncbi:MAG: hypothetical protein A3G75_06725 [Verrucomicrobia bacterium RIFCSPLOWO2_12_FULL_64_8]|nr:MAG: hypothetical protein A3G75_06725 [Verrucomicrobia bacterium RIFCSPLOWO2_12_FULL_64_8]
MRFPAAIAAGVCATLLTGCYTVPVTGRAAMNIVSDQDVAKMSKQAFEDLKKRYRESRDRVLVARVNRVGERLSQVVPYWEMPEAEWEFVVFDVPQINAFAMSGGKVGVFSGLFKIIQNDDQLASVIAHEIAHVTAKHVNERLSHQLLINAGGLVMGATMPATYTTELVLSAYGLSTGAGALAFDRGKEKEADHIGLIYMARAGYNPEEAIKVLENLEAALVGQPTPPAWLSTHPSTPERLLLLHDELPAAKEAYQNRGAKAAAVIVR